MATMRLTIITSTIAFVALTACSPLHRPVPFERSGVDISEAPIPAEPACPPEWGPQCIEPAPPTGVFVTIPDPCAPERGVGAPEHGVGCADTTAPTTTAPEGEPATTTTTTPGIPPELGG